MKHCIDEHNIKNIAFVQFLIIIEEEERQQIRKDLPEVR